MILGSPGSGKSTLARALGRKLCLHVCHLDRLYAPEGRRLPIKTWCELTRVWTERDAWIIEGNFLVTLEFRYARADTLILLDLPRVLCLWRAWHRSYDPHAPADERVPFDRPFAHYIWMYHRSQKQHLEALPRFPHPHIVTLRSPSAVREFLRGC